MKDSFLQILRCVDCGNQLVLENANCRQEEIVSGVLVCANCGREYPVIDSVPRFVPPQNYAANFGLQWNRFRATQLDSDTGVPISRNRFIETTGWSEDLLRGKRVLDVGCGAGRFAEIALALGAHVAAIDYSSAVDACYQNLGRNPRVNVLQASVYQLPFEPGSFDYVYCLGVLQHTPDVEQSFACLPRQLKSGGQLVIDVYWKKFSRYIWPIVWMRPITRRMRHDRLLTLVDKMMKYLYPISLALGRVPKAGRQLRHLVPVYNLDGIFPLSSSQLWEWAYLNTFDRLSATYEYPQRPDTVQGWFQNAGMKDINVFVRPPVVGRGSRP